VLPDLPSRASPRRGGATVLSGMRGRHSAVIARRDGGCHSEPAAPHLVKAPPLRQRLLSDKFRCEGDRLELAELRHASGERRKRPGKTSCLRRGVSVGDCRGSPAMGQQFSYAARRLRRQPLEDVFEVSVGIAPVEHRRLDRAHHRSGTLPRA
jgi:hypothetical protein